MLARSKSDYLYGLVRNTSAQHTCHEKRDPCHDPPLPLVSLLETCPFTPLPSLLYLSY